MARADKAGTSLLWPNPTGVDWRWGVDRIQVRAVPAGGGWVPRAVLGEYAALVEAGQDGLAAGLVEFPERPHTHGGVGVVRRR